MSGFRLRYLAALMPVLAAASAAAAEPDPCTLRHAPRSSALLRVPFRIVAGRIYVDARVDGKGPYTFAIDTGASGLGRADASLTAALGLPLSRTGESSDGINRAAVDMTHFRSLGLGGFVRTDLDVISRGYSSKSPPEAAIAGIIGRDFFADGLLIIDYPARTVTFSRRLGLSPRGKGVLHYDRAFRVPVLIGGVRTEGNLDTGANVGFVLPKTLFDRVGGGPLETAGEGTLTNTRIATSRATVHGPFRIGNAAIADADVRVSEHYPELLVGAYVLQNYAVLIDQRSHSVALCGGAKRARGLAPTPARSPPTPAGTPASSAPSRRRPR